MSVELVRELEELLRKKEKALKIIQFLMDFYTKAIHIVETTSDTMYMHPFNTNDSFIMETMPEILKEIKLIFPDCSVKHFLEGRDGEMVIVTESLSRLSEMEYKIIDWA